MIKKHCPEEQIIAAYQSGKTCAKVGEEYGCSYGSVYNILTRNNVKLRSQSSYMISKRETLLTETHKQIIDGLLLGDGSVRRRKVDKTASLNVTTVEGEFADHFPIVLPLNFYTNIQEAKQTFIHDHIANSRKSYRISSTADLSLNEYRDKWYPSGVKIIPKDLVLTPVSVKYWLYGDGTTHYKKHKNVKDAYVNLCFCTHCFSVPDCELLIAKLEESIGLRFHIENNHDKPTLVICEMDSINKFFDYIGECDVPCYQYKWKRPAVNTSFQRR